MYEKLVHSPELQIRINALKDSVRHHCYSEAVANSFDVLINNLMRAAHLEGEKKFAESEIAALEDKIDSIKGLVP